jgi:multidrug resistance efflux pump
MDTRPEQDLGQVVFVDRILWSQLDSAKSTQEFCRAWLALQCSMIADVRCAVIVLREPGTNAYEPTAFWPERSALRQGVATLADRALDLAEPQIAESDGGLSIAYPIDRSGDLLGVVSIGVAADAGARTVLRQLQWGSMWLSTHFRQADSVDAEGMADRLITVLDLIATALSYEHFGDASRALVTEMAVMLECDRVSVGFLKSGHAKVIAVSHSSHIGGHMNLVRSIGNAMDEAIDQQTVIVTPVGEDSEFCVTREHVQLSGLVGGSAVMTVPLSNAGKLCGAITFERPVDVGFDPSTVELCKAVGIAVGPMLETKRREDRSIFMKIPDAAGASLGKLIGPGYIARKLIAIALLVLVGLSTFLHGEYRVSATSRVEGAVRRVITAPVDGYIASANARPGDIVDAGQLLFEFDDRDLRLERVQVGSERAQMAARLQDAMANRERADVQIINAQIQQADAHLALLDEQIRRTKVSAPFNGVIVSGDLSQSLGAAIERGAVLFEIAPLDRYRVILEVDEHDIADVMAGQEGSLLLAALPGQPLAIQVTRLTSVASTTEGANYFRVEADLLDSSAGVRPGMEGVGKIDIEERRLISIWTHKTTRWLKLRIWSWTP